MELDYSYYPAVKRNFERFISEGRFLDAKGIAMNLPYFSSPSRDVLKNIEFDSSRLKLQSSMLNYLSEILIERIPRDSSRDSEDLAKIERILGS